MNAVLYGHVPFRQEDGPTICRACQQERPRSGVMCPEQRRARQLVQAGFADYPATPEDEERRLRGGR